jgi:predicted TIM-barrel fold metal-dependent hydrolase
MIAPQRALADLDSLGLDDETRELFLGRNAARVFKLNS